MAAYPPTTPTVTPDGSYAGLPAAFALPKWCALWAPRKQGAREALMRSTEDLR